MKKNNRMVDIYKKRKINVIIKQCVDEYRLPMK
jgi:hypothetical protein